jgi:hypothetical protein
LPLLCRLGGEPALRFHLRLRSFRRVVDESDARAPFWSLSGRKVREPGSMAIPPLPVRRRPVLPTCRHCPAGSRLPRPCLVARSGGRSAAVVSRTAVRVVGPARERSTRRPSVPEEEWPRTWQAGRSCVAPLGPHIELRGGAADGAGRGRPRIPSARVGTPGLLIIRAWRADGAVGRGVGAPGRGGAPHRGGPCRVDRSRGTASGVGVGGQRRLCVRMVSTRSGPGKSVMTTPVLVTLPAVRWVRARSFMPVTPRAP